MAKGRKYKKPPRGDKELASDVPTPSPQKKAMLALGIPPTAAPVKKMAQLKMSPSISPAPTRKVLREAADGEVEERVDSGNEADFEDEAQPNAPWKKGDNCEAGCVNEDTIPQPIAEEPEPIPQETLDFMAKWLPKWHTFCRSFPQPDDFDAVAPYCSAAIDIVVAFVRDVTSEHISKKGLPFDTSPGDATPWEVQFDNVFYPSDKIRNYVDINIRRFELFVEGENMEGRMWVDMSKKYRADVEALLAKVTKLRESGTWEKESRRVNEMTKFGAFGGVDKKVEGAEGEEVEVAAEGGVKAQAS